MLYQAIFCALFLCYEATYLKYTPETEAALCLDGSPAALYLTEAGDQNKILLHFQSGGWCGDKDIASTLENCYNRSLTNLGSSKYLALQRNFTVGILSEGNENYFSNWTKVFLPYCDGSTHQGYRKEPVFFKKSKLYFRGHNITIERFQYLNKKLGLYDSNKEVVLSGASAGGLATYFWVNYLQKNVKGQLRAVADSGIFINAQNSETQTRLFYSFYQNLMTLSNSQIDLPVSQCLQNSLDKVLCYFAQNLIPYIETPLFSIQSYYDFLSVHDVLGINCIKNYSLESCNQKQMQIIEKYHNDTRQVFQKVRSKNEGQNGYWGNGCSYHGYTYYSAYTSPRFRIPQNSSYSINYCLQEWIQGGKDGNYHEDVGLWPQANRVCSGVTDKLYIE